MQLDRGGAEGIFLVVCPATVLSHWLRELQKWSPSLRSVILHGVSRVGAELISLGSDGVKYALKKVRRLGREMHATVYAIANAIVIALSPFYPGVPQWPDAWAGRDN